MAMIIDFKAGSARIGGGGLRTAAGSAEIVLFPGVRYERMSDEPAAASKPASRSRKKRDKLELED